MGKVIIILLGIVFVAAGGFFIYLWQGPVLAFIEAMFALSLVMIGLGLLAFGISEIRSAAEERRLAAEVEATPPPPPVSPAAPEKKAE